MVKGVEQYGLVSRTLALKIRAKDQELSRRYLQSTHRMPCYLFIGRSLSLNADDFPLNAFPHIQSFDRANELRFHPGPSLLQL